MTLGQKIAEGRKQKGWTQDTLAEQLGISRQAIAKWESDQACPSTANLFSVCKLLDLNLEEASVTSATGPSSSTATPAIQADAEIGSVPVPWAAALFFLYLGIATALTFTVGIPYALGLTLLLLLVVGALLFAAVFRGKLDTRNTKSVIRYCLTSIGLLLLGALLCVGIWCARFCADARYQAKPHWNISAQTVAQFPDLSAWVENCKTRGSGIYVLTFSIPDTTNRTRCLVYRHAISTENAGSIQKIPLRYRFVVSYHQTKAGDNGMDAFDILEFDAQQSYQVQFQVAGKNDIQPLFFADASKYQENVDSLWGKY